MEYPFVTVTDAGADLLASTNGDPNNSLVIDKAVFSNQKSNTNKPLEQLTPSDFANPLVYQITTVKHHQNTIQPEVTLDNKNFQQNYPIYMIGILAHAENDSSGNETLYAVEEASNDPMIMPKATDNDFNCTFGIPIGISRSQDVNIVTTEAGTVSDKDFKDYKDSMDSQLASSAANQVADSSSLTNLSQSASYNSSNIGSLTSSFNSASSANSMATSLMNGVETHNESSIDTMYQSIQSNSADITTMKGKLSDVANNTSVSTAISNVSNATNTLSSSVSSNSSNITTLINQVSGIGNNSSVSLINTLSSAVNSNTSNISTLNSASTRASGHFNQFISNYGSAYSRFASGNYITFHGKDGLLSATKSELVWLDFDLFRWFRNSESGKETHPIPPGYYTNDIQNLDWYNCPDGFDTKNDELLLIVFQPSTCGLLIDITRDLIFFETSDYNNFSDGDEIDLTPELSNYATKSDLSSYQGKRLSPHANVDMNSIPDGTFNGSGINISHGPIDMSADDVQIYTHTETASQAQKIIDYSRNNIYIRDYAPGYTTADGMNYWYVFKGTQIKPNS